MEFAENSLAQRVSDRMEAMKELALAQDKITSCIVDMEFSSEQEENEFMVRSSRALLPLLKNMLDNISLQMVEVLLDGDPRYYEEEEE